MDSIKDLLRTGDLRGDGNAAQVAELVLKDKKRLSELLPCLDDPDSVVRAHASHAVEALSQKIPEALSVESRRFIMRGQSDAYPIVRWHMAMTLGNLAAHIKDPMPIVDFLLQGIQDTSPLVRSWSVYALVQAGRSHPIQVPRILEALRTHGKDRSPSVQSRLNRAITLLQFPDMPLPATWIKQK